MIIVLVVVIITEAEAAAHTAAHHHPRLGQPQHHRGQQQQAASVVLHCLDRRSPQGHIAGGATHYTDIENLGRRDVTCNTIIDQIDHSSAVLSLAM